MLLGYSGIVNPVVTDGETDNNSSSTASISSGNLITAQAPDLLIFVGSVASQPTGLSAGWTQRLWDAGNGDTNDLSTTAGFITLGLSGGSEVIAVVLGAIDYNTVLCEY